MVSLSLFPSDPFKGTPNFGICGFPTVFLGLQQLRFSGSFSQRNGERPVEFAPSFPYVNLGNHYRKASYGVERPEL